jgi:hypothetical protein
LPTRGEKAMKEAMLMESWQVVACGVAVTRIAV